MNINTVDYFVIMFYLDYLPTHFSSIVRWEKTKITLYQKIIKGNNVVIDNDYDQISTENK